jgi:hypothetical protein
MMLSTQIITSLAEKLTQKMASKIIRHLQKSTITLSGDDSGLKNTWDEICVQIQYEYSFHWEVYLDLVEKLCLEEVLMLEEIEKFALWLQTDSGFEYEQKEGDPEIVLEDIIQIIKKELFYKAGNWSNDRIRKYLDQ